MRRVLTNPVREALEPLVEAAKKSAGDKPDLARPGIPRGRLGPGRPAVARPAGGLRRPERRLPAGQAAAARGQLGPPVRRPPADSPAADATCPFVDSTTVRARQHAAGAGQKARRRRGPRPVARRVLGEDPRICSDEDAAVGVAVALTPGQRRPQFGTLFDAATAEVPTADEGYDSGDITNEVLDADAVAHIPSESNAADTAAARPGGPRGPQRGRAPVRQARAIPGRGDAARQARQGVPLDRRDRRDARQSQGGVRGEENRQQNLEAVTQRERSGCCLDRIGDEEGSPWPSRSCPTNCGISSAPVAAGQVPPVPVPRPPPRR